MHGKHIRTDVVPEGWFRWERPGLDFPFYEDGLVPTWHGWLLLGSSVLLAAFLNAPIDLSGLPVDRRVIKCLVVLLLPLATLLYVAHGDMGCVIKRPRLGDIPLVIVVVVLDFLYTAIVVSVLSFVFGIHLRGNAVLSETMDASFFASVILQLFGEELFKTNMLLGCLLLVYRKTGRRKLGVVVGTAVSLAIFGITHMEAYGSLLQVILIQGLGSLICVFAYLKTKNMLVTYAAHVVIDFIPFTLTAIGVMSGTGALSLLAR